MQIVEYKPMSKKQGVFIITNMIVLTALVFVLFNEGRIARKTVHNLEFEVQCMKHTFRLVSYVDLVPKNELQIRFSDLKLKEIQTKKRKGKK